MSKLLTNAVRAISKGTKPLNKSMTLAAGCLLAVCATSTAFGATSTITPTSASETSQPTLFDTITNRAKVLAKGDFKPLAKPIPEALAKMDYDQYRSIRFRPDSSLWRNEANFEIQLFHAGYIFKEPVVLHMATNGNDTTVPFKQEYFNYEGTAAKLAGIAPRDLGYAGFRVHYPLNNGQYKDEFMVFQGASSSYFRIIGPGQAWGLSARGLAIL